MHVLLKALAVIAAVGVGSGSVFATKAFAQTKRQIVEVSPYVAISNEPRPRLIVDPTPLAAGLALGLVWIQYRAENVRILPVFGTGALTASPRIGHLHVHIDDVPWGFVEDGGNNTISIAGLPAGQHKMRVELVDTAHHVFAGCGECVKTVSFTVPEPAAPSH